MAKGATGVKATLLEGEDNLEQAKKTAGAFWYYDYEDEKDVGILHSCPCGCGNIGSLNIKEWAEKKGPLWTLSGPREAPTLTPSVGIRAYGKAIKTDGDFHWHGWLRDGVWESV